MTSTVSISNVALAALGANRIVATNEGTEEANLITVHFDQARQYLLSLHPWNFAMKRVQLGQDATKPPFRYDFSYTLPADFMRVVTVQENIDYKIETNGNGDPAIFTNKDEAFIKYVFDQTDVTKWDFHFVELMSAYLTVVLAYAITKSSSVEARAQERFDEKLSKSKFIDGTQDIDDKLGGENRGSFINARFSGSLTGT